MKRSIFIVIAVLFAAFSARAYAVSDAPDTSAASAIVMHSGGEVIYEKNADAQSLIASTTKLMTAIDAIENCGLDDELEVGADSCGIEGSSMYLHLGQCVTVEDLLYGLLLVSGNDAADALARYTAGSIEDFAALMNEKARNLGMTNSPFSNPHGLDAEDHYSTARDMAVLMDYCMSDEDFVRIISASSRQVGEQCYYNHNKLLWRCEGCIGGKTGYTLAAGRCLVSCCERDGTRLICVTLSDPDDWNDHCRLYDWAFSQYSDRRALSDGSLPEVPVTSGTESAATVRPSEELSLFLPRDAELTVRYELPRFVFAPVNMGEHAGRYEIEYNGEVIADGELVYAADVPRIRKTYSYLHLRLELA